MPILYLLLPLSALSALGLLGLCYLVLERGPSDDLGLAGDRMPAAGPAAAPSRPPVTRRED